MEKSTIRPPGVKIGLVILRADPARGGAERYTVDLGAALQARGHDASILASGFAPGGAPPESIRLDATGATRLGRYLRFLDSLDQHLRGTSYDVIHAMLPVRHADIYHPHAGIAADEVLTGHLKHNRAATRLLAKVANRVNRKRQAFAAVERTMLTGKPPPLVLSLSRYIERSVRRNYAIDDPYLRTLLNGVDLARFDSAARPSAGVKLRRRLGIAPDKVIALIIAQDFLRKGLREAILATASVGDERLVLLVAGKQDPGPYSRLAAHEGIANRVLFAGPTSDPYEFYRASDCFILPTRHDPCSLVVLEALAMGLPVISTAFNGACEAMVHGRHGFVLSDPGDVSAAADALIAMLDDRRRLAMAAACQALRPELAYSHHVDELFKIYQSVAAS